MALLSSAPVALIFPVSSPDGIACHHRLPSLHFRRELCWVGSRLCRVNTWKSTVAAARVRCQRSDHIEREPDSSTYEERRNDQLLDVGLSPSQPSSVGVEDEVVHVDSAAARTHFELGVRETSQEGSGGSKIKDLEASYNLQERGKRADRLEETLKRDGTEVAHTSELPERWRDYHGANYWRGLLDPLDQGLRLEILKYGEFTQATYDAFDSDTHSKYCGSCLYGRRKFFEKLGLSHRGYSVTKYLYATSSIQLPNWMHRSESSDPWSHDSNWIGFVAVTTDEKEIAKIGRRDILICWRGTIMASEWLDDLDEARTPIDFGDRNDCAGAGALEEGRAIQVESGFWSLYTSRKQSSTHNKQSASEQVITEVKKLLEEYKGEELSITITGHSLGGALAYLSAFEIAARGLDQRNTSPSATTTNNDAVDVVKVKEDDRTAIPICLFTFGCPRVGNQSFKTKMERLGIKSLRVVNVNDVVPKVPGMLFNDGLGKLVGPLFAFLPKQMQQWAWAHAGLEVLVNNAHSPVLKPKGDAPDFHNLEAYLHLVDGHRGGAAPFASATSRDVALVNKSSNFLREELLVPPSWMQAENKGMVRDAQGRWVQPERDDDDVPSHPLHS